MAQKTVITLIDDITGQTIDEGQGQTVLFSLDGSSYEIDLSNSNADSLRNALEPYTERARKISRPNSIKSVNTRRSKQDLGAVREWLRGRGHKVSDRGRIPEALLEEYQENN